ncbi:hypothetical protein [Streptomyces sp. N35]|uniref:hypothetical protein n=1 Tax=Streptomyces sp. N35 TaxID=2795730 RepID=UPI0018F73A19|nr:hypothetical protein [Streptomyces sp. N35]
MTAAGVTVRWPFTGDQWFPILGLIEKAGVPALVAHAQRDFQHKGGDIGSARYFVSGWRQLPPHAAPGTQRPRLRAVSGWQPYQQPPASAFANDLGF